MFRPLAACFPMPGTISTDAEFYFKAPCDLTLRGVSAAADNTATTTTINVGTSSDPDGYIDAKAIPQDDAAEIWDLDDFNGDLVSNQGDDYPHITKGTIIVVAIDVGDGTDPIDPCIVLWFEEG